MFDIDFTSGNRRFNYRVAGVAIQQGHVLLHTMDDADFWILPGGRVAFGETATEALVREMKEELGQTVRVGRLLWLAESFMPDAGKELHAISLYYAMDLPTTNRAPFAVIDGGMRLSFAWHSLAQLDALTVYPPFLQQHLLSLPDHPTPILDIRTTATPRHHPRPRRHA